MNEYIKLYPMYHYHLLLFAQKKKQEKGTPAVQALRAALRFSLLPERWKLGFASDMPASFFGNICDAQLDRMGPRKTRA